MCILPLFVLAACRNDPTPPPTVTLPAPPATDAPVDVTSPPAEATMQVVTPAVDPPGSQVFAPIVGSGGAEADATVEPSAAQLTATPSSPTATPEPDYPSYSGPPLDRERVGVQIYLHRQDVRALLRHFQALNVGWVKVQVSWKLHEPRPGEYDAQLFGELDRLVAGAHGQGVKVLLSVSKAPEWSRSVTEEDGPPADYAHFENFMAYLAGRYRGQVAAYELWNEPNLRREWNGVLLDPATLVELIRRGAAGVRATDPGALIVSAAPAVTGINDGVTAIDDRVYLRGMLAAGLGEVVDGVGVHPYGWANPPDSTFAAADSAATSHNDHPSFFFLDTLEEYHALLVESGAADLPLWATEFGWGTFENMLTDEGNPATPPDGAEFMNQVDEWQQAVYTLRAYELAQERPWLGPLFLWNLNFAPGIGSAFAESGYSILRQDGSRRPAYRALEHREGE